MTGSDFQPDRFNIEELLTRRYYRVPRFQRPYSWDPSTLDDFWVDVFEDNDPGYFIGPMVGWRASKTSAFASIVDGQQRLTTIIILLAIIRDAFADLGQKKYADGIHQYIHREDRNSDSHFVLQPESETPGYFNLGVLSYPRDTSAKPATANETSLAAAHDWLARRLSTLLAPAGTKLSTDKAIALLQDLRDRLLGLYVIWIEHGNEDDAYVLFETLNSRGKDLDVADLLKNLLFGKLRPTTTQADIYRPKWDEMRRHLDSVQPPLDVNRFIQHWWLSREDYVAIRKLFGRIKAKVRTPVAAQGRLDSLVADSALYRDIFFPEQRKWTVEESSIRNALDALATFGVIQPAPLLLALLRARRDTKSTLRVLRPAFEAIEHYHFQTTAVTGSSSSGGVSAMYARFAREFTAATAAAARTESLQTMRKDLANRLPDQASFDAGFSRLNYSDVYTRDKKLVQYVSRRLHESERTHRPGKPTLEHLLPQDQAASAGFDVIGSLGNIFYFEDALNNALGNKTFVQKKTILAKHAGSYDIDDVLNASDWGPSEIAARTQRLAALARTKVWSL